MSAVTPTPDPETANPKAILAAAAKEEDKSTYMERVQNSKIYKTFYRPDVIAKADIDEIITTLSVVNALVFTIPFGMMGNFNAEAWDAYQSALAASSCNKDFSVTEDVFSVHSLMLISLYTSLAAILFSLCYYFSNPGAQDNDENEIEAKKSFLKWWKRGRYCLLLLFLCTVCSVVGTVGIANMYYAVFMVPTDRICDSEGRRDMFKILYSVAIAGFALMMFYLA